MTLVKGIDISSIQGNVDFKSVKDAGYEFVIIRCAVGNNGSDSLYAKNVAAATAAGLKVGCYNFVFPLPNNTANSTRDPKVQAAMHYKAAGDMKVVFCDLEWPPPQDWSKWSCSAPQIVEWSLTYLKEYERLSGVRPIIYIYPNFAQNIKLPQSVGQDYKLWIASYTNQPVIPSPWTDWVVWQNTGGTEKLPNGVPVDTNFAKDLSLWDEPAPVLVADDPTPDVPTFTNTESTHDVPVASSPMPAAPTSIINTIIQSLSNLFK